MTNSVHLTVVYIDAHDFGRDLVRCWLAMAVPRASPAGRHTRMALWRVIDGAAQIRVVPDVLHREFRRT